MAKTVSKSWRNSSQKPPFFAVLMYSLFKFKWKYQSIGPMFPDYLYISYDYVEMKQCIEMNRQRNWLIQILIIDCRILRIVKNTRLVIVDDWTVQKAYHMNLSWKTTSNCKVPIVQVGWRFKLILYSLNSQYCLRKLNENSRKTGVHIHLFLPYKNSNSSNMTQ